MKKRRLTKKNRVKILSLMLTICMVISCLPVNIIAASSEADLTEKTTQNEELIDELLEPIIVEEDISKRGENEKHFLCDDGSYIAITYSDKVHEIVDNEWVDIEYDVEDDGKEISPKDEDIKVKFANNTNSSKLVKIDADGYKISWTVEAETEDGEGINKVKLSKESKSVLKTTKEINKQNREKIKKESKYGYDEVAEHKNAAKKELKKYDLAKTKDLDKNEAVVFANNNIEAYNRMQIQCAASYAQSMIEYKDAFGEGHTLRYMLTEGSINEEIVLDSYKGFKSYSMVIDTDGLTPVVNEYGKVELTDADGKVIMYIDAPYMYDAVDAISENITVTAEQESKKTWRISYTPDQEWLTSEDRVYPVVIDPTVSTRNYPQTSVLDAFVYNGQTDYSDRNLPYLRVGYTTGKIAHISYWGVNQLPSLPNNAYMTGAGLYIRFTNDTEDSENIAIYSTSGTLNTATMNWASRPSVGSFLDNQASFPSAYWVNFCSASFGEKVRDAYRYGTPIAFAMKYADGSSKYQYNEFYSADCADTSYRPYLSVKYTLTFADVAEGDYYIRNLNSGKCLSVRNSGTTAGTTVTQYEFGGTTNQVWTLSKTSGSNGVNNAYHLTPKNATGLCLYYSASTIKAQINNYPEYDRSKWRFEEISTGVYSISSAIQPWLALDVDNYSTEDGADVYVYAYHGNDNQLWVLDRIGTNDPTPTPTLPEYSSDVPSGMYFIKNEYSNKNLQYSMSDDSVTVSEHRFDTLQMWNITNFGNGNYSIKAYGKADTYLEILNDTDAEGQPLSTIYNQVQTYSNMRLMNSSDGTYKICPILSTTNRVLTENDDGSITINTNAPTLITQNWVFEPVIDKKAVILIHGRDSNSAGCYGAVNDIGAGENNAFNVTSTSDGDSYVSYEDQRIDNISGLHDEGGNLAYYLEQNGYIRNVNLFVFNYPNQDAVIYNAQKFEDYVENLVSYATNNGSMDMKRALEINGDNYSFNIVGHSMGGLVARYYIENLENDKHVEKLITIDTPHWGSGYADIILPTIHKACDHDLDVDSAMYGGSEPMINGCIVCQTGYTFTDELQYSNSRQTKYYAIAGVDFKVNEINQNDYIVEIPTYFSTYTEIEDYLCNKNVNLNMNVKNEGDNIVGLMSQIGWKENKNGDSPTKIIPMEKIYINFDTNGGNGTDDLLEMINHFHGKNQHRTVVMQKVESYLQE